MTFRGFNHTNNPMLVATKNSINLTALTGVIPAGALREDGEALHFVFGFDGPSSTGPDTATLSLDGVTLVTISMANSTTGRVEGVLRRESSTQYTRVSVAAYNNSPTVTSQSSLTSQSLTGTWDTSNHNLVLSYDNSSDGAINGVQAWKFGVIDGSSF